MKNLLLFAAVLALLTVSSCTSTRNTLVDYLTQHNFQQTHQLNPVTGTTKFKASIDSLYDYTKVAQVCDTANITLVIARGRVEIEADCTNAGEDLVAILKKLLAKIELLK